MYYSHDNWYQQGWVCPKCGRVYSPSTPMCFNCGNNETTTATTTTIPVNIKSLLNSSDTFRIHPEDEPIYEVGGSDYYDPVTRSYVNKLKYVSNGVQYEGYREN